MITSNTDIEKLIYDEARLYFPELFYVPEASAFYEEKSIGHDVLSHICNDFEALPMFLCEEPPPSPLLAEAQPGCQEMPGITKIRDDFPILKETVNGKPLIWFDNAATTQKPRCVIDRLRYFYEHENSNVHRAAHALARRTTDAYEGARRIVADFLGAASPDEIIFVRGATEGINLVASSYGPAAVSEGDEILISELEHHANIVPWQFLCAKTGAKLRYFPVDDSGQVLLSEYKKRLTPRTKIVAFTHVSNVLGTITPAEEMVRLAHNAGAVVLIDGAQAAAHLSVNVRALEADFYVFSGHKIFGPTGIGVLYGKYELLNSLAPYQGGGNMISSVTLEESRFKESPHKFEAGTGSIADVIGLGSALRYLSQIGPNAIAHYENTLTAYLTEGAQRIPGLTVVGTAAQKSGIVSFYLNGFDCDEVACHLDREGIAVRAGHHCAQPVLKRFGLDKIVRASLAVYNTFEEIDSFVSALSRLTKQPCKHYHQ